MISRSAADRDTNGWPRRPRNWLSLTRREVTSYKFLFIFYFCYRVPAKSHHGCRNNDDPDCTRFPGTTFRKSNTTSLCKKNNEMMICSRRQHIDRRAHRLESVTKADREEPPSPLISKPCDIELFSTCYG